MSTKTLDNPPRPKPRRNISGAGPEIVPPKKKPKKGTRKQRYTAATADKFELYQLAVQSPETDVEFLTTTFQAIRGRTPLHFREDFCGTALLSSWWVKQGSEHTAEGFDLDPEPVEWGQEHNIAPLGDAAQRVTVHLEDARQPGQKAPDVRVAQNFSYWIFQERPVLLEYFRLARASLAAGGMFVLDSFGGDDGTAIVDEERKIEEGFTYVWDQVRYHPGTAEYRCKIHFHFRDGSKLLNAFDYTWRAWGMAEIKDLLREAGFAEVHSYFEVGSDDEDEEEDDDEESEEDGTGEFVLDDTGENGEDCAGWIAYIVAYD